MCVSMQPKYAENLLIREDNVWGMGTLSQIVVRLRLGGKSVVKNAHLMVQMDSFLPTLHLPHSNASLMFAKPLASWITYGTRHSPFHGLYSSTQVGCETCPVGHYSKEQGATRVCTPCSRGEYQSFLGHDEVLDPIVLLWGSWPGLTQGFERQRD